MKNLKGSAVNKIIKITKKMWKLSTMFSKKFNFFCPQKVEKNTLKSLPKKLKSTFFPYCQHSPNGPNGPNRRIHVPKCGLQTNCIQNWDNAKTNQQKRNWKSILCSERFLFSLIIQSQVELDNIGTFAIQEGKEISGAFVEPLKLRIGAVFGQVR